MLPLAALGYLHFGLDESDKATDYFKKSLEIGKKEEDKAEELIIDFGLNPQPFGVPAHPIPVTQRIITNFYTAKRMLHALQLTIQRHEATFGVLETDVQKRVRPGLPGQARG